MRNIGFRRRGKKAGEKRIKKTVRSYIWYTHPVLKIIVNCKHVLTKNLNHS